jgi:hypothetical protein
MIIMKCLLIGVGENLLCLCVTLQATLVNSVRVVVRVLCCSRVNNPFGKLDFNVPKATPHSAKDTSLPPVGRGR